MSPRIRQVVALLARQQTSKCPIHSFPQQAPIASTSKLISIRRFATHSDRPLPNSGPSSSTQPTTEELLRQLGAQSRKGRTGFEGHESVGPFPLGVGASGRSKSWRKWNELGVAGKVVRAGRQTGNLGVIVIGGTFFVILAFALSTELFAKNSPGVLYSQAVDLIRDSDALNAHLLPPLSFTHTPHSSAPIRGSPPLPTRHILHPRSGREHLMLTFWVHGRGIGEEETLGFVKRYYKTFLEYGRQAGEWAGMIPAFDPAQNLKPEQAVPSRVQEVVQTEEGNGWLGGLFGGFSGLRNTSAPGQKGTNGGNRGLPPPGTYKIGEVHGDYVKNAAGQYQLLSLVIDIPASQASYPTRAVAFWSPEADSEGLQGRKR